MPLSLDEFEAELADLPSEDEFSYHNWIVLALTFLTYIKVSCLGT